MPVPDSPTRVRKSAEERREELVAIAIRQFALNGYKGTSTETIAQEAGISQPYLFRLFKTKRELFLACVDVNHDRVEATFERAAQAGPREQALERMGDAYVDLLRDNSALLFQMQSYAACSDPVIRERVRERYGELVALATRLSGAEPEQVWQFFAHGMLLNVMASLDLPSIADRSAWAAAWCEPGGLIRLVRDA
jgi:AcrR family transcriptional regulator